MSKKISALLIGVCAVAVTASLMYAAILVVSPAALAQQAAPHIEAHDDFIIWPL